MTARVLGVYRELEHSPGKVDADKAILDAVLKRLAELRFPVTAIAPAQLAEAKPRAFDLVLAMCQSTSALKRLAAFERDGIFVINPTLAIRNCCRDLLQPGLTRARAPVPPGRLVETRGLIDQSATASFDRKRAIFVKPADPEALGSYPVVKLNETAELQPVLSAFAAKGLRRAYVQQAVEGIEVKFYGIGGGHYFAALPDVIESTPRLGRKLAAAARRTAETLGLEVWGGDAIVSETEFSIVDFNAWPSFGPVREAAAHAIAQRCVTLLERATGRLVDAKA